MSQKTNPTSLRLQKISQNFSFPLFADYFWSETYQTCIESQNYITSFFKETSFSEAFFSAKMFYRKFPVFVFIQDNRVTKKEKLLFFKNPLNRNVERKSQISKKSKTKDKNLSDEKLTGVSNGNVGLHSKLLLDHLLLRDDKKKKFFSERSRFVENNILCKDFGDFKQLIKNDFLKAKQGFCKNMPNTLWASTKKLHNPVFVSKQISVKDNNFLFNIKTYKTENFWPKQPTSRFPKFFARPCFSFCENVISLRQRKNLSINNALFGYEENMSDNTNMRFSFSDLAQQTKSETIFNNRAKQNSITYQDQQNHHQLSISGDILNKVWTIQKKNQYFLVKSCANKAPFFKTSITLQPIRFINDYQNVTSLVDQVVALLEKRISFRQIKSLLFKDFLYYPQIKGIRISCSGRLGGRSKKAQKAKVQSDSCGATTLAAFSSNILFASKSASTSYGKVGVKIWLSYNPTTATK